MKYIKLFEGWDEQEMDSEMNPEMEAPVGMDSMEDPMETPEDMDQEAAPEMSMGNSYPEIKSFLDNLIDKNESGEISSEEAFDAIQKEL